MKGVLFPLLFLTFSSGRFIRSTATLDSSTPWTLLAGFGIGAGVGKWEFKAKLTGLNANVSVPVYQFAIYSVRSDMKTPDFGCGESADSSGLNRRIIELFTNSRYSDTFQTNLPEQETAWHWRVYIAACNITEDVMKVKYTLSLLGPGGTHNSVEEIGTDDVQLYLAIGYCLVLIYSIYKFLASLISLEDVEGMLVIITFGLILEIISQVFSIIHTSRFAEDGKGWVLFRFFSQFLDISAQLFLLITYICVAYGYFIKFKDIPHPETITISAIGCIFAYLLLMVFDQFTEDTGLRNGLFKGIWNKFEVGIRVFMLGWVLHTATETTGGSPLAVQKLMGKFKLVCFLAFAAPVVAEILSFLVSPEYRYKAFLCITHLMQGAAVLLFLRLFSIDAQYHRVTGVLEVLPSSKLHD